MSNNKVDRYAEYFTNNAGKKSIFQSSSNNYDSAQRVAEATGKKDYKKEESEK